MLRLLTAPVRRRHRALWVEVRYMEPFGTPTWAVRVQPSGSPSVELARGVCLTLALLRAYRAAPTSPAA